MESLVALVIAKANYWAYIIIMMVGMYAMIAKNNLIKKIVGMIIFQTAVIMFYVSIGCKKGATIPILQHGHGHEAAGSVAHASASAAAHAPAAAHHASAAVNVADYINPLPHVLMLTAIVVGVATLGVALALAMKVYKEYGTLEEDEINQQLRNG